MVSKVFLLNYNKLFFLLFISLCCVLDKNIANATNNYTRSYFGSILSGQIANYNNDSALSASFFNHANKINPKGFIGHFFLIS